MRFSHEGGNRWFSPSPLSWVFLGYCKRAVQKQSITVARNCFESVVQKQAKIIITLILGETKNKSA